ncbi:FkbM family methyltransferase [Epilithonimonas ginsengisoli]|uniref:FkbM family methyltransferase n=1 Tax=Epilithonimonas ginsengisoli TaxID=1245592 RepID=A0ABU4JDZ3_9FLAO|nr:MULTISPECIES: FkbM family methyltransferase [Chryseobacterium group]MBV6879041.1 FkbM family methyltransferase [Epilithonimonas sp. FP105]MDW8547888.1 FkbM family methyltransferase [Epilithonimonas ginsengisoli]OAH74949.1 methyltransferase FkbM [Chryseobacterium sp. FP211-J200]
MSVYSKLAENLQYLSPSFYKSRFFKKLKGLDVHNLLERKVEPEFLWIKNILSKDAVFMDVGANVGAYLFTLENHLKPENIFAFEPNPQLFKRLGRLFPKVNLSSVALSDISTIAEFKIPVINGEKVHTRGTLQTSIKEKNEEKTILQKVKVKPLDELDLKFQKLDFIKIDVEGNEMQTLRGAKKNIEKFRPILMVEMEQRHHKENLWTLISEVADWGYSVNYLDRETLQPKILTEEFLIQQNPDNVKNYKDYINNIIFLPNLQEPQTDNQSSFINHQL